jgi:hypothetical protein
VAKILKKYIFSEKIPFFHDHVTGDSTESLNNKFYNEDYRTYLYRKENNFFLNE